MNDGVPLPQPIRVLLPPIEELEPLALDESTETQYETNLYNELKSGHKRSEKKVIHEINKEAFGGLLPSYSKNPAVPQITSNCNSSMMCDMHYELDWSYRLRTEVSCDKAEEVDPCFATTACMCDTGYFSVADTMPEKRSGLVYDGFIDVFEEFERVEDARKNGSTEDEDQILGLDSWLFYIIVASAVVVILAIIIIIIIVKKRRNKGNDKTK